MRSVSVIFLLFISLSACSKQDSDPVVPVKKVTAYQGISVTGFSGVWNQNTVQLSFSLSGNLSGFTAIKIFSGNSSNQLCLIGEMTVTGTQTPATFSYSDADPKGSPTYYMLGIEDSQGHLTYLNNILGVSK